MSTTWISKQPVKYWALSVSMFGLGACSSTKSAPDTAASDSSFEEMALESKTTERSGGAEGSVRTEIPNLDGAVTRRASAPARLKLPEIAQSAFQKGDYWLNGYVFVRKEKSWQDVSKLIYGRADRAALLSEWNANVTLRPGAVVYYNSPFRPDDGSFLKPFDADFGMTLDSVAISAGDTLPKIAQRVYGVSGAWRELAVLNMDLLSDINELSEGQVIRLSPQVRDTAPILQAYVQKIQNEAQAALAQNSQSAQERRPLQDQEGMGTRGAQAPPSSDSDLEIRVGDDKESLPWIDMVVMLVSLAAVAGLVVFFIRRRKSLVANNAANMVFFGRKKTGTDD